ncbi:alkaline phosphatase [Bacterioplanes sanyensis]|uniref:Alkaline phosphatase n=1 Tax=Bacterioplanes sanyensis TaxID=1249553 RepID=A0A222FJS0_9GAMM|nr:alkaline phosphatase [Bacterioplanes sanyensis]ASP39020.1 alkaline phosphatase [Bacterioplanes sanyensis]
MGILNSAVNGFGACHVRTWLSAATAACVLLLTACSQSGGQWSQTSISPASRYEWAAQGHQQAHRQVEPITNKARNLVLVVGDGMGITTLTAARIFAGQQQGLDGEEYRLSFEQLPYSALVKTYNSDRQTPDSAGTMTALVTGHKTDAGVLSLGPQVARGDCGSQVGQELQTLFDHAQRLNKRTAIVTTARVTHATPAALYAHSVERNWESDDELSDSARQQGCVDIAQQLLQQHLQGLGPDIVLGGGKRHFLPQSLAGQRLDGRNLMAQWQQAENARVLTNAAELAQHDLSGGRWLGLFADSHLPYVDQRPDTMPGLQAMVEQAYAGVKDQTQGYVLVIEAGRIDHAHHAGNAARALTETQELHHTMGWLLQQIDLEETLVVVTADHSHTLTLAGYPTRGNPILGLVRSNDAQGQPMAEPWLLNDGKPYTSLSYRNGPGAVALAERPVYSDAEVQQINFKQPALVPMAGETHGGEDVALYAAGPWAHLFGGTLEQHWVFHVMQHALSID